MSEQTRGDGRALYARAKKEGWEGLLVKGAQSPYRDGKRSPEWRKLKITNEDEFVIGGWTEPKGARSYFGSLILGTYDAANRLVHAGDVGTGYSGAELERLWKLVKPLETDKSPFVAKPKTLGRPHWVEPKLVAQVKFTEWTDDGRLRHPVYLGLRDDKKPHDVKTARTAAKAPVMPTTRPAVASAPVKRKSAVRSPLKAWSVAADAMTEQLNDFEQRKRDGKLSLPDGDTLDVSNLQKIFWHGPSTRRAISCATTRASHH